MEIKIQESEMVDTAVEMMQSLKEENEKLLKMAETFKTEVDRLTTVLLQESINRKNLESINGYLKQYLGEMLDEHEAIFSRTGQFESTEFAEDYINAATAARFCGRKGDLVNYVQEWLNSEDSLPFKKR